MKIETVGFSFGLLLAIFVGIWCFNEIYWKSLDSHGSPTPSVVCPAPGVFEREVLDCLGRDGVVLDTGSGAECVVWSREFVKNRTKIGGG